MARAARLQWGAWLGLAGGLALICGAGAADGLALERLWQPAALAVVVGGALAAVLVETPVSGLRLAAALLRWVFATPALTPRAQLDIVLRWSWVARREGILALDAETARQRDPFVAKALQLLVDGRSAEAIRRSMEVELEAEARRLQRAVGVYESLGGYAPIFGMLGAVLGLIRATSALADPARLGPAIAAAFVATVYGLALANLFCLPVAERLRGIVQDTLQARRLVLEGVVAIAEGDNPHRIRERLTGYCRAQAAA
ncbi:MAG: flagellar motor protein [Gammaproteobacteria bacterium]|nr:MAG: flagellar motor protein [Gammaproteobacteria bacterium]